MYRCFTRVLRACACALRLALTRRRENQQYLKGENQTDITLPTKFKKIYKTKM